MDKKRVGILRGGQHDYENSLQKGGELILHITDKLGDKWQVFDIFIDKNNIWHLAGKEIKPALLMHKVDVVWNLAHPSFSNVLQSFSIPVIGHENFSNFIGESRALLEEHMKQIGVKMPKHLIIPVYQKDFDARPDERNHPFGRGEEYKFVIKKAKEVHEKFSAPWIVQSLNKNSNMGIHVAETFPELERAIEDMVNHGESILVEEFISGKNAEMHSVSNFRGEDIYTFPAGNFSKEEKEKLTYLAEDLHKLFHIKSYLNSQFVLHPKKGIYLTSVNFCPDLKNDSTFNESCISVGAKMHHVVEHMLEKVIGA